MNSLQYVQHEKIFHFLILKSMLQKLLEKAGLKTCFWPAHSHGDETLSARVQDRILHCFRLPLAVLC